MAHETSDHEQGRKEVVTEVFKALILVNGGACLALVTFLKDSKGTHLSPYAAGIVLLCFAAGVLLAFASAWIRFEHSVLAEALAKQKGEKPPWYKHRCHLWLQGGSAAAFLIGCGVAALLLQQGRSDDEKPTSCECRCR